ncbi:MAG: diguanylate cyclase domain protein [Conexibacter sp.]|nr:diguanylate cyclase domain protein [Conexibacter sp.]
MTRRRPPLHIARFPGGPVNPERELGAFVRDAYAADEAPATPSSALARMAESEAADTLRAIGAGEVDAFVISDGDDGQQVFALTTADRPYRMFVENMRDGAVTLSPSGLVLFANRRLSELLALPAEVIVGAPLASLLAQELPLALEDLLGADGLGATLELELRTGAGATVPVLAGTSPLDVDGDRLICITFADLSAHKEQEREIARLLEAQDQRLTALQAAQAALTQQATHDALTGLPNRALLVDRIDQSLAQASRSGRSIAVLFVDLDRFKQVNDTRGHSAGDAVLSTVAARLSGAVRPMDTVARIGGDEFVILAPELESNVYAFELSRRLIDVLGTGGEAVGASIGVSVWARGATTAETMLNEADAAMYHAKSLGGGRTEVFDEALGRQVHQRFVAQQMLEAALAQERVLAHYQPIVDLASGTIAGFEALVRITAAEDGSIVSPAAFVPIAEETGLIKPLGTRMLRMACDAAGGWPAPAAGERGLTVAVNLSSRQFEASDLVTLVQEALRHGALTPARLHLELTETAIMDLRPEILRQLGQLRDLGVEIGLDDFGTGYASLTHLRRLPLTFVKIDRTFVTGVGTDHEDDRIVAAVIDLASNLGLRSIAEGVETPTQLQRLRDLGCDQAQGYLFARPMPAADVGAALARAPW